MVGGTRMKKNVFQYVSPEIKVIVLQQGDIVTFSAGTNNGADGNQGDGNWWN